MEREKWIYTPPPSHLPPLTILNHTTGQREPLQCLPVHEGRRTLGVHLRPDGSEETTFKSLLTKATKWADRLRSHPLTPTTTWLALNSTLLKTLEYPLPSTTLSLQQCNRILWPALRTALPLSKIQRRFPRTLLHAPIALMGLGLPHLYTTQLYQHILVLLRHGHTDSLTGNLLRASIETLRLEIGSVRHPLTLPWQKWGSLATPTWLTSTWQMLSEQQLGVTDTTQHPPALRSNDKAIMDFFVPTLSDRGVLRILNHCRLYLEIFWLSEVLDAKGDRIDPSILNGAHSTTVHTRSTWPRQGKPSPAAWKVWKSTLLTSLCDFLTQDRSQVSHDRGRYNLHWAHPTNTHYLWKALFHPSHDRVYTRNGPTSPWQMWTLIPTSRRSKRYQISSTSKPPPISSLRSTVHYLSATRLRILAIEEPPPYLLSSCSIHQHPSPSSSPTPYLGDHSSISPGLNTADPPMADPASNFLSVYHEHSLPPLQGTADYCERRLLEGSARVRGVHSRRYPAPFQDRSQRSSSHPMPLPTPTARLLLSKRNRGTPRRPDSHQITR